MAPTDVETVGFAMEVETNLYLTVIIPAFKEAGYLPSTLDSIQRASEYLRYWRQLARLTGMVQGATQFCRRSAFESVGGYDENVWMGEDVDFFWSLKKLAKETGQRVQVVRSPKVLPSTRRFDKLPVWKVLLFTNPLFITLFRRWKSVWADWYQRPVR